MDKTLTIGVDIDGVLSDFCTTFKDRMIEVTGVDLFPPCVISPPVWTWPQHFGYTDEQVRRTWDLLQKDYLFWECLTPYQETTKFLRRLGEFGDDIYFITSRPGVDGKLQSERWLEQHGYPMPTVINVLPDAAEKQTGTGPLKAMVAKALRLTHFIDDRADNCREVKLACPETQVFLLHHNYNRAEQEELQSLGIVVIHSVQRFIEALDAAANN